jgi:hypothetical protein
LFVSASRIEGFGNAIWEALACGVPVVAMDAGPPVRALVRHGIDGVIVSQNTMAALANALATVMRDETQRKAYASRAPEVVERFPFEAALEQWDELFRAISFSYSRDIARHSQVVKLAHRLLAARARRNGPDPFDRRNEIAIVAANEADVRRDDLRTRALVAANHGRA